jgi:CheY-like chemotaxis protein
MQVSGLLLLRLHGYEAQTDGPKALQSVRDCWPDAVLLDLSLPGMDGYQVARRITPLPRTNRCSIAITGYGESEDRRRSLEAGIGSES